MASFKKQINEIRLPKYLALYIWSRYERLKPFLKSVDPKDYLHKLNYRFQRKTAKLRLDKLLLIFLFPSLHFSRYWQSSETCKILTVIWDMQNFSSVALGPAMFIVKTLSFKTYIFSTDWAYDWGNKLL